MKTNKKQEDETRKCFATLQEARDFCNINDRSNEDIFYLPDQNIYFVEI